MKRRLAFAAVITVLIWADARACMRDELDTRAVQWSSLIVEAKLTKIDDPTGVATTRPGAAVKQIIYHFQVQTLFDGIGSPGDEVKVVRFFRRGDDAGKEDPVSFDKSRVGKSMILALRRGELAKLPDGAKLDDSKKTFVVVYVADAKDFDANDRADLKRVIADVRKSESGAVEKQITQQVHAAAFAEDETEAAEAEDAIRQMGTKALPELQKALPDAPSAGKTRVKRLIDELTPPPVPIEREAQ